MWAPEHANPHYNRLHGINSTSVRLWSTAVRWCRSQVGIWMLWEPPCFTSARNSVWRNRETRWEQAGNKNHEWSGGSDDRLRSEPGRDITECRKIITGSCINREVLFLFPGNYYLVCRTYGRVRDSLWAIELHRWWARQDSNLEPMDSVEQMPGCGVSLGSES